MASNKEVKKHLILGKNGTPQKYTYPRQVIINSNIHPQDRTSHGANLLTQLKTLKNEQDNLQSQTEDYQLESVIGVQISFESYPDINLEFEKLADARSRIEVLNVIQQDNKYVVTILVPIGKLRVLEKKIEEYLNPAKDGKKGPKHSTLLNAIASIRKTAIENLWSDDPDLYPSPAEVVWLEVWLPILGDRLAVMHDFIKLAQIAGIQVSDNILEFPERTVLLAKGSIDAFSSSSLLMSKISELRRAKVTAEFFDYLELNEQRDWLANLLDRTTFESENSPYVCILDTGVNRGHPLLSPLCSEDDLFVVDPNWDVADSNGHGTAMAGLAVWGDLSNILAEVSPLQIKHRIESVKLLRFSGDNDDKHLGNITSVKNKKNGTKTSHVLTNRTTNLARMSLISKI